jgi:hypothetical protein
MVELNHNFKVRYQSVAKNDGFGKTVNEDCLRSKLPSIVVSDGAGGTGLFADKWSAYLCERISLKPICNFEDLCVWQDSIWEDFYNEYKPIAEEKGIGGKFLEEGSSATLVALWQVEEQFYWCTYGDSVLFHFDKKALKFANINNPSQFNQSPWLLNWKDTPNEKGFQAGTFTLEKGDKLLVATDTLAQYILIAFLTSTNTNEALLNELAESGSRLANCYQQMVNVGYTDLSFHSDILTPLRQNLDSEQDFESYLQKLYQQDVIGLDDYSLIWIEDTNITESTL